MTTLIQIYQLTHAVAPSWIGNEYAGNCPFNVDNSKLLLIERDHFILVSPVNGDKLADLPIQAWQEPRWSRSNPNFIYYVIDSRYSPNTPAQVLRFDIGLMASTLVGKLSYSVITGRGESDICSDGDHLALCGDDTEVILYSIRAAGPEATYQQVVSFNWLKITPRKKIIIGGDQQGIISQPLHRQITQYNGHAAVAEYQGHDILLWASAADPGLNQNAVMLIDLDSGSVKPRALLNLPWAYAFHITVCDLPWCVVSTYDQYNQSPLQIYRVWYDGRAPELLHEYQADYRNYTSQPKAAVSRDGKMVVWSVDDGTTVNTWIMRVDVSVPAPPVVVEPPVDVKPPSPPLTATTILTGLSEIDFTKSEGQHWVFELWVEGGKLMAKMYDKVGGA